MKAELYEVIQHKIEEKINYFNHLIKDLRASNNDTKSSMGDKYETSREMMQQEITRIQNQLNDVLIQQDIFSKLKIIDNPIVGLGSYVETSMGNFCIACSFGEIENNGKKIFILSTQTPLVKELIGKSKNDLFEINNKSFQILDVN